MKKLPNMIKPVSVMLIILGITVLVLPIINIIEKEKNPPLVLAVLFLFCSMFVVHAVLRNMAKRIEQLEELLGQQIPFQEK